MAQELSFRPKTGEIPTEPGVYRFIDSRGRVLYVGKAKSLRARLQSYFAPLKSQHERTRRMLKSAANLDWTIVKTEFEALQLEFTWIKEFDPPFNIRFRDDKSYPYLAVSLQEPIPRVFITRNRELKGVRYFGPYTQAWVLRQTLDTLLKVYPMRSCSKSVFATAKRSNRACLLADIGKCSAPCVGRIGQQEHVSLAKELVSFMNGMEPQALAALRERMNQASRTENFELAARLRDNVAALESVLEKSTVVFNDLTDADIFGLAHDELAAAVCLFSVRGGRIRGVRNWLVDTELNQEAGELIRWAITTAYATEPGVEPQFVPNEILVPHLPEESSELELFLITTRGQRPKIKVPKRGDKAILAETVNRNAEHALELYKLRRSNDFSARSEALNNLAIAIGLPEPPLRIECFDISHLSGTATVGSMVVFEDGLPRKNYYRLFNVESTGDDTAAIYEVISRRAKYLRADSEKVGFALPPALMVIDGGAPQVSAARKALRDAGITNVTVCGLAKRLEELYLADSSFPIVLPRGSDELFLLQRIRDESHRFALTASRKVRSRSISSILLEIPGLGDKRVAELLKRFRSTRRLAAASVEEIAEVAGIGKQLAEKVLRSLNSSQ